MVTLVAWSAVAVAKSDRVSVREVAASDREVASEASRSALSVFRLARAAATSDRMPDAIDGGMLGAVRLCRVVSKGERLGALAMVIVAVMSAPARQRARLHTQIIIRSRSSFGTRFATAFSS